MRINHPRQPRPPRLPQQILPGIPPNQQVVRQRIARSLTSADSNGHRTSSDVAMLIRSTLARSMSSRQLVDRRIVHELAQPRRLRHAAHHLRRIGILLADHPFRQLLGDEPLHFHRVESVSTCAGRTSGGMAATSTSAPSAAVPTTLAARAASRSGMPAHSQRQQCLRQQPQPVDLHGIGEQPVVDGHHRHERGAVVEPRREVVDVDDARVA